MPARHQRSVGKKWCENNRYLFVKLFLCKKRSSRILSINCGSKDVQSSIRFEMDWMFYRSKHQASHVRQIQNQAASLCFWPARPPQIAERAAFSDNCIWQSLALSLAPSMPVFLDRAEAPGFTEGCPEFAEVTVSLACKTAANIRRSSVFKQAMQFWIWYLQPKWSLWSFWHWHSCKVCEQGDVTGRRSSMQDYIFEGP